jgi:hypothetical protein
MIAPFCAIILDTIITQITKDIAAKNPDIRNVMVAGDGSLNGLGLSASQLNDKVVTIINAIYEKRAVNIPAIIYASYTRLLFFQAVGGTGSLIIPSS